MPLRRSRTTQQQTEDDNSTDDDDQDDDTEWEEDNDKPDKLRAANNEAKRRRLQAKAATARAEEAERELARLKGERATPANMTPLVIENALLRAGVPADRIAKAVRAFDADALDTGDDGSITNLSEAVEDFRRECSYFWDSGTDQQELPSTGSRHNSPRKGKPSQKSDAALREQYPALYR